MLTKCFSTSFPQSTIEKVKDCLESGTLGFGPNVSLFEEKFAYLSRKKFNLGMNSASSAAYAIFHYLHKIYGECEIYTPSLAFVSPYWAAKKNGHSIVFVDVDDNFLFDVDDYLKKRKDNGKKKIVMPILYGGVSTVPKMNKLVGDEIVVVDSAHCITPTIESDFMFFSFHPVKPMCMANGGMISTDNSVADAFFQKYRNFGRVDKSAHTYDIVDDGFNFYMNNLNAAIGLSQFESAYENIVKRKRNFNMIKESLPEQKFVDHDQFSSYYLATLKLDTVCSSDLRSVLRDAGLETSYHYPFLHMTSRYCRQPESMNSKLRNTENHYDRFLNIPIHQNLNESEIEHMLGLLIHHLKDEEGGY